MTRAKRTKVKVPTPPAPPEISTSDRAALTGAYQTGLIREWKRDPERGYRLTVTGRQDAYVEVTKLNSYLERLKGATSPPVALAGRAPSPRPAARPFANVT